MKHTTHSQTQVRKQRKQQHVRQQQPDFPNLNVAKESLDRPRLYARWVEIDGKLTCTWYSD